MDIVCCVRCNGRFSNWKNAGRLYKHHNIHSPLCDHQVGDSASVGDASSDGSKDDTSGEANATVHGEGYIGSIYALRHSFHFYSFGIFGQHYIR